MQGIPDGGVIAWVCKAVLGQCVVGCLSLMGSL